MTLSPARVPDAGTIGVRRLTATLYGYAFLDDFVLLYPVYALLFSDTGLSIWQISSLFALWSITGILLEVPSGAWADAVSRRLLLWLGPLLTATGFALWVIVPSYWAFALGFVLWGCAARSAPVRWRRWSTTNWTGSARPTGTRASSAGPRRSAWSP